MGPSRLREGVRSPIPTVIVTIVVRLGGRIIPERRVELADLILTTTAFGVRCRVDEWIGRRTRPGRRKLRWPFEIFGQALEQVLSDFSVQGRLAMFSQIECRSDGHVFDELHRQLSRCFEILR